MSARLHLPHPHLVDVVRDVLQEARYHLGKPRPVYTDPAVIERWGEWLTPDEWEHEHDGSADR